MISSSAAYAVLPDEVMSDPAKEARARNLSRELRCMVCQNELINDSEAPLARDIRLLVRERIAAGDSDAQVLNFLVARYGEFVLLKPRLERQTLLLWLLTPSVLAAGALALWINSRRRRAIAARFFTCATDSGRGGADQPIDVSGTRVGSAGLGRADISKPGQYSTPEHAPERKHGPHSVRTIKVQKHLLSSCDKLPHPFDAPLQKFNSLARAL